jgi:hypothetical protein
MRAPSTLGWLGALFAFGAGSLAPLAARAGTPDLLIHSAPRPAGSDLVVLAYENGGDGILYSRDRGETFSALCSSMINEADGDGGFKFVNGLGDTIVTGDGHVLAGDTRGLWVDDGQLCNWQRAPELKDEWVTSLAHDPRDPNIVYGVLASSTADDNGLFRRNADGSVDRVGVGSSIKIHSLQVVERPDGGLRFYQGAIVGSTPLFDYDAQVPLPDGGVGPLRREKLLYALRVSDDEGQTWTEHDVETDPGTSVSVEAVDPTDIDRLVIRLARGTAIDTLVFVEQAGAMQRPWLDVEEVTGVVFEPSGAVWIAGSGVDDGVWRADELGADPTKVRDHAAFCIALNGDDLELCDRMDYGVADKTTGLLSAPRLYDTVDRVHSCEGVDVVEFCRPLFCAGRCAGNHWPASPMCADSYGAAAPLGCSEGFVPSDSDASTADASTADASTADASTADAGAMDGGVAAAPASGCGCSVPGARDEAADLAWIVGLLLSWRVARRRRAS